MIADKAGFIRANTRLMAVPHAPEIHLHLATELVPLWQATEEDVAAQGLPPPFWAFAWAGGQALARHILDAPDLVRGRRVLDFAAGSGLVGIAAARAGAMHVLAIELDPFAIEAIALNAQANGVTIETIQADLTTRPPPQQDTVLVGDAFYERELASAVLPWLRSLAARGADVLIGDPGRSWLPRKALVEVACYEVPTTRELEDCEIKRTRVWRLAATA
jgi:predicted nicotinamide N-methyase